MVANVHVVAEASLGFLSLTMLTGMEHSRESKYEEQEDGDSIDGFG